MTVSSSILALPLLLAVPALAAAQAGPGGLQLVAPFGLVADRDGIATVSFDAGAHALLSIGHDAGGPLLLRALPLPGGRRVDLVLTPTSALEPGARAVAVQADGSRTLVTPEVRCFQGHVAGDPGATAFLGVSPTMMNGYVELAEDTYFLSTAGDTRVDRATIAPASLVASDPLASEWCGFEETPQPPAPSGEIDRESLRERREGALGLGTGSKIFTARMFLEADHQFRGFFSSDQDCADYVTLLMSASSSIYRRDLGVVFSIPDGYLRIWNTVPPWGSVGTFNDIYNVQAWWSSGANPDANIPRAAVHVLTRPVFGGVALSAGGLCGISQGYEISSLYGSFPNPVQHTSPGNWDLIVLSHEYGHTFGSNHTFNYTPPIPCFEGSGPDNGTIMSYCHLESGGTNNVGMRFHVRVQDLIRSRFVGEQCLNPTDIVNGDYDADGDVDTADLAVADTVLNQGFRSRAAEEVFDVDGDEDYDALDRELLDLLVSGIPAAQVTSVNGSGLNSNCYFAENLPILGTTWKSDVFAFEGTPTIVFGYSGGTSGIFFSLGELLVDTTSTPLFSSVAIGVGFFAVHDVAVPLDPALAGATATVQAFTPAQACNALEIRVNIY